MTTTAPLLAVAAALSWALSRLAPSPRQKAVAAALVALLAIAISRPFLRPWEASYVAAFVAWYAVTAWGVVGVLARREPWAVGFSLVPAVALPFAPAAIAVQLGETMALERFAFALSLAVQLLAALRFLSRGRSPDDAQRVALVLMASSVIDAAPGPWMLGEPARDWGVGLWISAATWIVVAGWEVRCLIRVHSK